MEAVEILEKTRTINNLFQHKATEPISFVQVAETLANIIKSMVIIVTRQGQILGRTQPVKGESLDAILDETAADRLSEAFNSRILEAAATEMSQLSPGGSQIMITPVYGGGDRLGTILFFREKPFTAAEIILAEAGAVGVGAEVRRLKTESQDKEHRKRGAVNLATEVLSFSELEAVKCLFLELKGHEGFIIASKLAQKYNLTRSVIVNALRKLESAGVIATRSLGMKGTYIRVLNEYLFAKLEKM